MPSRAHNLHARYFLTLLINDMQPAALPNVVKCKLSGDNLSMGFCFFWG